jgi:hypothetical protein
VVAIGISPFIACLIAPDCPGSFLHVCYKRDIHIFPHVFQQTEKYTHHARIDTELFSVLPELCRLIFSPVNEIRCCGAIQRARFFSTVAFLELLKELRKGSKGIP